MSQLFRGKPQPTTTGPDGKPKAAVPSANVFEKFTSMVCLFSVLKRFIDVVSAVAKFHSSCAAWHY